MKSPSSYIIFPTIPDTGAIKLEFFLEVIVPIIGIVWFKFVSTILSTSTIVCWDFKREISKESNIINIIFIKFEI